MGGISVEDAVRGLCLALPDVEAFVSHGMATFRRRKGKVFAILALNHHGDGRIGLWVNTPPALQAEYVDAEPRHFYVPQYVGPSGWLGVRLDQGLAWKRSCELVRVAYEHTNRRTGMALATPSVPGPSPRPKLADVDPMQSAVAKKVLGAMRKLCLALPETSEGTQFGNPVWRAGRRVFAQCFAYRDSPLQVAFWVGVDRQGLMTMDPRFRIPAYLGPNGWIGLDVSKGFDLEELQPLALESYRHFALARMIKALPA